MNKQTTNAVATVRPAVASKQVSITIDGTTYFFTPAIATLLADQLNRAVAEVTA